VAWVSVDIIELRRARFSSGQSHRDSEYHERAAERLSCPPFELTPFREPELFGSQPMLSPLKIHLQNGKLCLGKATTHVLAHACTTARRIEGVARTPPKAHVFSPARSHSPLFDSARIYRMDIPYSR